VLWSTTPTAFQPGAIIKHIAPVTEMSCRDICHAEIDTHHRETDKRPQSLTGTSRHASRERNR
jgi:hypothetical protein